MKITKKLTLMIILVLIFLINFCYAEENGNAICSGRVINTKGEPVESVKVGFYKISLVLEDLSYKVELVKEMETHKDGKFEFETEKFENGDTRQGVITAQMDGFGLGWGNWSMRGNDNFEIILYPVAPVSGVVVDESDKPIADAEVLMSFLMIKNNNQPKFTIGELMPDMLSTKTDWQGKFSFDKIPENAEFDFRIKKPGRATIVTMDINKFQSTQTLNYTPGKTDIKIVQPLEAILQGVVVEKDTGKPVSGAQVIFSQDDENMVMSLYNLKPAITSQDGSFVIESLPAKAFSLQLKPETEIANEWISKPVEVTTKAGQTTSDVKIELIKGGVIEVLVKDLKTQKPIDQANVSFQSVENNFAQGVKTDSNGLAKIRVNPGIYKITNIHKQDYISKNWNGDIIIDEGKTKRFEITLESFGQFSGTVRDQNGNPLPGVSITTRPPTRTEEVTDAEGKFVFIAKRGISKMPNNGTVYILARDKEKNLATAVLLEDKVENYDIKLSPGIILKGKVVDINDNSILNTNISLTFWISNTGYNSQETTEFDSEGNFEIRAVPENHKYSVRAFAEGYGDANVQIDTGNAQNGRIEMAKMVLKKANLSVSGIVVDEFNQPMPDIRIYAYGNGQPNRDAKTDKEGKFTIEKLCDGPVELQASSSGSSARLSGDISTIGGAKDIKIMVRELSPEGRPISRQPLSLVSKTLPGFEHIKLDLSPDEIKDKQLLICFFDMEQRPSRNAIMQLKDKAQNLKEKDISVLIVHVSNIEQEKLDEWFSEYEVPFIPGRIESDSSISVEKIRFDWGVKALPWLILTNKEHIVQADGFPINELDENIK